MQPSPADCQVYVWQPPGARQTIEISLEVINRISDDARAGLVTQGRGMEMGGLLLGRTRREHGRTVVEIAGVELVDCEHAAGPSLMLSNADRRSMDAQIRSHKGAVVGFYRSNTRREFVATVEDLGLLESHFPLMLLVDARRGAPLRAGFVFRGDREMGPIFAFTPEALKPAAAPPPAVAAPAPVKAAPVPVAVPASTTAPVRFRIPKTWFAAAAVVLGIGAGVMYDGVRRESRPVEARRPAPTVEKAATPKPEPPPQESVADRAATDGAAADPEPPAGTPPPPTPEPVVERAAAPPARTIEPPAKAEPLVSRPVGPTAPVVAADRAAPAEHTPEPPASARRRFVPPAPAARTTVPVELVDVPKVDLARPSMAPPVIATAAAAPAPPKVDSRVAVAVDPVPQRGGSFVAPVTVQRAAPRDIHVARPTVINVRVYVDRTGKVDFAELLSDGTGANRDIATAAVFSARKWRFSPAMVNGKAVPAQAVLRFRFEP